MGQSQVTFLHPEPRSAHCRIRPVFLPYAGCPSRCLYCAQDLQTGRKPLPLSQALRELESELRKACDKGCPTMELAFYGATFTALDPEWQDRFLTLARRFRDKGCVSRVRCSTRPDALSPRHLARLKDQGLDMVELGVQSFADGALRQTARGYDASVALEACAMVKDAGLALGVQLMPGMPGQTPDDVLADAAMARDLRPEAARLYPCLVIEGSGLARAWRKGEYQPWPREEVVPLLASALTVLWSGSVRVIRVGLASEPGLDQRVLAGPIHPSLGLMARSLALFRLVRDQARTLPHPATLLRAPRRLQGEFWGHRGELRPEYAALGLGPGQVLFETREDFLLA